MPKLSRWFIKSALVCLILGSLAAGVALSASLSIVPALAPVAWHLLTVGWATQLIFGVAFWMFPPEPRQRVERFEHVGPRRREPIPRGDERLGWTAFWLLNGGLALRAIGEPAGALWPAAPAAVLLPVAAVCQVAAIGIFVVFTWPRVRATGR
jgi:hypothetical protein